MTTVIKVGKLIDGTGAAPQANMTLIIEGKRIIDIVSSSELTNHPNAQIFNFPTLTAIPGMIDCHDHLAHMGMDIKQQLQTPPSMAVLQVGRWITETLTIGITSDRDAGGLDLGMKMAVENGIIPGPRLWISLVIITQTGGHADYTKPWSLTTESSRWPGLPSGIADGVEGVRHKVREVIRMGADWVKVATTGGIGSARGKANDRQFTSEELKAIVNEAHNAGKPVFAHAHGGEGLKMCIEAGVDSIEHGAYADDEDLQQMADRHIWLVPTLSVFHRMLERIKQDPSSVPEYTAAKTPGVIKAQQRSFRRALELNVPMAMGTDSAALGHGENTRELVYMVQAGMTPMQAIVTSTKMSAQLLGMGNQLGTLEKERLADILLVDGDPLADISVLANPNRVVFVMKDGIVYKAPR